MAGLQGTRLFVLPCFLLLLVFLSDQRRLASADKFTVGDGQMWNANVNYTAWVEKHKPFHVGDWLGASLFLLPLPF